MATKTSQLQIRLTRSQKAELKRRAAAAGETVSSYVLKRTLPRTAERFQLLLGTLEDGRDRTFALAGLNDLLTELHPSEFSAAVACADLSGLSDYLQNYVAAMVELAAHQKGVKTPTWTRRIAPLTEPKFGTELKALRPYLLGASPVPFKRRNIFIDVSVGSRI